MFDTRSGIGKVQGEPGVSFCSREQGHDQRQMENTNTGWSVGAPTGQIGTFLTFTKKKKR